MTLIAEYRIAHPDLAFASTIEAVPSIPVKYLAAKAEPDGGDYSTSFLLFLTKVDEDIGRIEGALRKDPSAVEWRHLPTAEDYPLYTVKSKITLPWAARLSEQGILVLGQEAADGQWSVRLRLGSRRMLSDIVEVFDHYGIEYSLEDLYTRDGSDLGGPSSLTSDQHELLLTAFERGYFEVPRRITQRELGEMFGVSESSISQRIRRALNNSLADQFARSRRE